MAHSLISLKVTHQAILLPTFNCLSITIALSSQAHFTAAQHTYSGAKGRLVAPDKGHFQCTLANNRACQDQTIGKLGTES